MGVDPTAQGAAGNGVEVTFIVVSTEREAEAPLTGSGPMACPRTAAGFREYGLDVIPEALAEYRVKS